MIVPETIASHDRLERAEYFSGLTLNDQGYVGMTIRFAPARNRDALARTVAWAAKDLRRVRIANDNGASVQDQELLTETLRHFAIHGLSAAEHAKNMATAAAQSGDELAYKRWHSVCRMLDRRMASALATNVEFKQ